MSFPAMTKRTLLDDLRKRQDEGRASPSNAEILELCLVRSEDQVSSLLAELAEAGEIIVGFSDGHRAIVIPGRVAQPVVRPVVVAVPAQPEPGTLASNLRRIDRTKQLSVYLPRDLHAAVVERARADQTPMSEVMRAAAEAFLNPTDRHRIQAEVIRAWRDDGREFGEFVTALIDAGLAVHEDMREEAGAA